MKWQPMPACAREPSGTLVLVLCGQPAQKYGTRLTASLALRQQLRRREVAHVLQVVAERAVAREVARDPVRDEFDQPRRAQLAERGHQRRTVRRRACRRCIGRWSRLRVVEQVAQLRLDHGRLLLDDEDLAQPAREGAHARGLERERQPHLVQRARRRAASIAGVISSRRSTSIKS